MTVFCPDGSQLAPGVVGLGVNLLADAYSENSSQTAAGANIQLSGVTATINPEEPPPFGQRGARFAQ